jgi:hypothetical protein
MGCNTYQLYSLWTKKRKSPPKNPDFSITHLIQIAITFIAITLTRLFFSSESIGTALGYLNGVFSCSLLRFSRTYIIYLITIIILLATKWATRDAPHRLRKVNTLQGDLRWGSYLLLTAAVFISCRVDNSVVYLEFKIYWWVMKQIFKGHSFCITYFIVIQCDPILCSLLLGEWRIFHQNPLFNSNVRTIQCILLWFPLKAQAYHSCWFR